MTARQVADHFCQTVLKTIVAVGLVGALWQVHDTQGFDPFESDGCALSCVKE